MFPLLLIKKQRQYPQTFVAVYTSKRTTFPKVVKNSKSTAFYTTVYPPHTLEENNPKLQEDHDTQIRGTLTPVQRLYLCHHSPEQLMVQNTLLKLPCSPTPPCLFTLTWCCLFLQGACSHSTPVEAATAKPTPCRKRTKPSKSVTQIQRRLQVQSEMRTVCP